MPIECRIKWLLLDKGMEQQQLAQLIGADPSQVSAWANNRNAPTLEYALKIAEALGCRVEDLFRLRSK